MQLIILGNNSALPAYNRHPTAQYLSGDGWGLLIDCGEGTQMQLNRYRVKWSKINCIFISHLHGDHYFGLPGLLNSMGLGGRKTPLLLIGPPALQPILHQIFQAAQTTLPFELVFSPIQPLATGTYQEMNLDKIRLRIFPVEHRISCHGIRVEEKKNPRKIILEKCEAFQIPVTAYQNLCKGADFITENGERISNASLTIPSKPPLVYTYCADTLYCPSIIPIAKGSTLLYHESTYLSCDQQKATDRFHSTSEEAARIALASETKALLLGHYSARYADTQAFEDEAKRLFANSFASKEGFTYIPTDDFPYMQILPPE